MSIRSHEQYALLTDYDTGSAYSEAYHTVFANIRFTWESNSTQQHTLLLATASPYAEQAGVVANVAMVAAQSGTPTILVDADLRTPGLQQRFSLGKSSGLSELLAAESITPEKVAASLCKTFIPNLRLLGAGDTTMGGASLLLSPKLETIVNCLRKLAAGAETSPGLVIFHSPPVLSGADASLISAQVEQTFLTMVAGRTTRVQVKQAQEQLQRSHANLVGSILLDV